MEIADTLGFLLGTWEVSRSYTDRRSGTAPSFQGRAVLALDAGGQDLARYEETGQLCLGSQHSPASRSLEYLRQPGGTVMLYRPGRQPYVDLDLSDGAWEAVHPCGADRYEICTVVTSRDVVQERWRVHGPGKDYTAVTELRRLSSLAVPTGQDGGAGRRPSPG
jgi:hypothetical protein